MAIDKLTTSLNQSANTAQTARAEQGRAAQGQPAQAAQTPRQDAVSLTQQAQQLTHLQRRAETNSGVDETKVAEIKKAISEGSYSIDAERLAAKIAHFEDDMFGRV